MSGIGLFGELWAIEELQKKKKTEIYLPLKDTGIDFVAIKGETTFSIQVKTSMFQKNSYFWFDLHKSKMRYNKNVYYIFVCATLARRKMMGKSRNFLVIPSLDLKKLIQSGEIPSKGGNDNVLNIFVYPNFDNKTWTFKNKKKSIDLTKYWNDFDCFN